MPVLSTVSAKGNESCSRLNKIAFVTIFLVEGDMTLRNTGFTYFPPIPIEYSSLAVGHKHVFLGGPTVHICECLVTNCLESVQAILQRTFCR